MRLVVLAALVALGCGKRSEKPITCADAARAGVDAMVQGAKERIASAQVPAEARDAMDERTRQLDALAPRLRAVITHRCVDDDWRADAIACFAKVKSMDDMRACRDKLAPDQQAKLQAEELDLYAAGPAAPPGFTSHAPALPPSEETVKLEEDMRALNTKLGEAAQQAAAASSPAEREAAQAIVKELQTQMELLDKQLSGSREQELQKQMEQLEQQLGSANAQP